MAEPRITEVAGLQTSNNTFSASPPGSLSKADNLIISQKGVGKPRNGQAWASTMPVVADLPFALAEFQGNIIANYGISKTDTSMGLGYVNAGAISAYSGGPYNPVGDDGVSTDYMRMKFAQASLFLHFCCASGPQALETYNDTPRIAGLSRMPDFAAVGVQATGTQPGFLPYNASVAYRSVLKRVTSTGQVLLSPPSNRFVVTNRFQAAIGGLVRTGGNTVTATLTPGTVWKIFSLPFGIGGSITLSPGEANFAAATYTVTNTSANTITWTDSGSNVSSTVAQELNPGAILAASQVILPKAAKAGDFIRLYRSVATSDSSIEPSDDLYLSMEVKLSSTNISAGYVLIIDYTPEGALQDPLYTNPSDGDGGGLGGSNFQPPLYGDIANWDGSTWYANSEGQQYLDLQMLGVGGPNGIQDGDTITIFDGVSTTKTFTFKNTVGVSTDIQIVSDGTPGYNIAWTTYFFTEVAGQQLLGNGLGIYGRTSTNGFPGGILIERTDFLQTAFQVKVSRPTSWAPGLSATVYTSAFASADPNGLWNSKSQQPEAVPASNFMNVGTANYYARRIFGLRNALIIMKEGDGIWSLTGTSGNYTLVQISTANTIAPDCACVFADAVWAYTDQGILRISDTGGVQVVSRPIETDLNALATQFPDETYAWSFAVSYETERRVMFYVPVAAATAATGGAPTLQAYCYSQATNAWTKFNHEAISGIVTTSHRLWTGIYDSVFSQGRVTEERKTGTYLDIADAQWSNTLTTTANPYVVQLATPGAIQQGSGISQGNYFTKVTAVLGGSLYQVAELVPWSNGACTIYDPYPVEVQFLPAGEPGARKVLTRLFTLYKPEEFSNLFGVATLFTDQIQSELEIPAPFPGFGSTAFGMGSFGNPSPMVLDSNPISPKWVNAGQFFPGFKLNEVWAQFQIQGLGMQVDTAAAPAGRGV